MSPVIFHLLGKILGSRASSVASASFCSLHEDVFFFFLASSYFAGHKCRLPSLWTCSLNPKGEPTWEKVSKSSGTKSNLRD